MSEALEPFVDEVLIDSTMKFPLQHPVKNQVKKMITTDHYPIFLVFKNLPTNNQKHDTKITKWNYNKPGGWKTYEDMTSKNVYLEEGKLTSSDMVKKLNKIETKVKFSAFGKHSGKNKKNKLSLAKDLLQIGFSLV